jgi:hypothetical protein
VDCRADPADFHSKLELGQKRFNRNPKREYVIGKINNFYDSIDYDDQGSREFRRTAGGVQTWIGPGYFRVKALAVFPPSGTLGQRPCDSGYLWSRPKSPSHDNEGVYL